MADPVPFTPEEMSRLAGQAIAKIDAMGTRGVDRCSTDEIVALAACAALLGVRPRDWRERNTPKGDTK